MDYNSKIIAEVEKTIKLQETDFELVSDQMREQLEINRETIKEFKTWNKNSDFNIQNLEQLINEQEKLRSYFDHNWNYKVLNPQGVLKFDHVYISQIFIFVEWHAGISFNHLMRRCLMFSENGFFKTTVEGIKRTKNDMVERIKKLDYNYTNLYQVDKYRKINFEIDKEQFNGTIIHDAIVGGKIKIGKYSDGKITDRDDIYTLIERNNS